MRSTNTNQTTVDELSKTFAINPGILGFGLRGMANFLSQLPQARQAYLSSEVTSLALEVEGLKKDAAKFTDRLSQLEEAPGDGWDGLGRLGFWRQSGAHSMSKG